MFEGAKQPRTCSTTDPRRRAKPQVSGVERPPKRIFEGGSSGGSSVRGPRHHAERVSGYQNFTEISRPR